MSRTRISTIMMETNSNQFLSFSGFNACNDNLNASFQNLFDKSFGNKKQLNEYDVNNFSETNESLLKTLNVIDFNIQNDIKPDTYTLEDLLDLGTEDLQRPEFLGSLIDDEPKFYQPPSNVVMETSVPSPVSSSSDESCDLDDILFMDEPISSLSQPQQTENISFPVDHQYISTGEQKDDQQPTATMDMVNGIDLGALCTLLFQNHGISSLPTSLEQMQSSPAPLSSGPSSPATSVSSESDAETIATGNEESVRYKPYSKRKQKTPEQKQRKMAQNRTAASRYRTKKKDELKVMSDEADQLEERNKELKGKVDGLKSEIDYLKNLMLDVIKARLTKGATPESLVNDAASKLLN